MSSIEVHYCKSNDIPQNSNRISPAPTISINPEIYYTNDSIVGYTYTITLNGYANALRKDLDPGSVAYGVDDTVQHIGDIRTIFNANGGNLYIKQDNTNIIVAKGATIKSINYDRSDNRWINYSPFTIELEFNEVDFIGCSSNPTISCNSSFFNASSLSSNLIDINQYKIREFSDKWSFTISNQIYESYSDVYNNVFSVNYTLSATGKNYYINGNVIPAWQQAKMFVQDRLHDQVKSLINGIAQISSDNKDGCSPNIALSGLFNTDYTTPRSGGLMDGGNTLRDGQAPNYDIYNETINCSTSEADGTFSITYNATIKKNHPNLNSSENAVLHTFTKNLSTTNGSPKNVTLSVQGNIQGLVRGGLIYYNNDFTLPNNGTFISTIDSLETKYTNALAYLRNRIADDNDLLPSFKTNLGVTKDALLINSQCSDDPDSELPVPTSFTLDHSYTNGTIGYNASYDTTTASTLSSNRGYSSISIVRNDPIEIIQEFIVPGRIQGPIIQRLGTKTARTISINIDGASPRNKACIKFCGDAEPIFDPCDSIPQFSIKDFDKLLETNEGWIKTKEDYTSNKIDGSYSISLEYTCKG